MSGEGEREGDKAEPSGTESSCAAAAASLPGKMPPGKNALKNASAADAVGDRDHISNLPDGVLQHMLSFLPAQDAIRTCVLAKRWRHMWKSTTGLRFVWGGMEETNSMKEFVEKLLRLRICGNAPLDTCEFSLHMDEFEIDEGGIDEDFMSRFIFWISLALECKVRVLQFSCDNHHPRIHARDGYPFFISQYLKKLELKGLYFLMPCRYLDFSCCPVLEDLEIFDCCLECDLPISSQSLKRLTIDSCYFIGEDGRVSICALNLVSLWLEVYIGRSPLLHRMPSLLTAVVKMNGYDCVPLHSDNDSNQSIILQGLSEVRNLVLISLHHEMFIFRRDLKFCSSFNKLKSLLIDEYWCKPADFSSLACLLKLCPVLEKLTLQLYSWGPKHKVETKLSCKPLEMSAAISQHLKTIELKCEVYDERINNVLMFLSEKLNIWFQLSGWKPMHKNGPTIT